MRVEFHTTGKYLATGDYPITITGLVKEDLITRLRIAVTLTETPPYRRRISLGSKPNVFGELVGVVAPIAPVPEHNERP